jgi:mobile mystery protein B
MALTPEYPNGSTPLDANELSGLLPKHITTQKELNEWEQLNILQGEIWSRQHRKDILSEKYIRQLHQQMFGNTWLWAGRFRTSNKNIGIDWQHIPVQLRKLFDDVKYHIDQETYSPDEIAIRFHHRLVSIHPFPNGNGRHARLCADLLIQEMGLPRFTWGGGNLVDTTETREKYIAALQAADNHNIQALLLFARS